MTQKTREKILAYIEEHHHASGKELAEHLLSISPRAVRKQLKNLLEKGLLQKIGKPPKVYYSLAPEAKIANVEKIDPKTRHIIDERYLFISPAGQSLPGWSGFVTWSEKTKQDPLKTAKEYIVTLEKYDHFRKQNVIDGLSKMQHTFPTVYVDKLFYLDFYSIERFGKTKLGQMLLYAKQSQNKALMYILVQEIQPRIMTMIKKYKIDGVLFIPPTVKREVQFMRELEKQLRLPVRTLSVAKVKTEIIVPQKTLSRLEDRVENAKRTIVVDETRSYRNILLIDDAVGSGATINETAKQLKEKHLCSGQIIGLAITGNFKGFDVISEV